MWTCLCIVRSSFKMHIHTLVHTHAYCQNWHSLFFALPTMTTSSNVKNFFFFFRFALFYTCTFLFFLDSTTWLKHQRTFCPATNWDLTHCREVLWWQKGDLNEYKLNHGFVPNCYMFSIWHLSKLLYMWGTFIVRDCLCVWAIIFNVCHSQRDGTVLHMLCKQAHDWSWIV